MTLEFGMVIALAGIVFGWGASWASLGQSVKSLKETTAEAVKSLREVTTETNRQNAADHRALLNKLEKVAKLTIRVAVLETKIFGKPHTDNDQDEVGT